MRYIKSFLVLAIAVLGFSFADVQAQNFSDNGKVSESNIEKKVFKEILRLPYYGVFDNIAFKVDGDTVTLYGKVVRPTTKISAENVVEDIKGVRNVVNNIEVLPLSRFDDSIRLRTLRTLSNTGGLYRYCQSAKAAKLRCCSPRYLRHQFFQLRFPHCFWLSDGQLSRKVLPYCHLLDKRCCQKRQNKAV